MSMLYPVRVNNFFQLVEELCLLSGVKNVNTVFSKKIYGNVKLAFLVCYKEKLNVSYRRFVGICEENNLQRMLCLKRIPHFTTLQKFVQRTPKALFELLVRACAKLLHITDAVVAIDGTGFSNNNPSQYYVDRIDCKRVKNYTKTVFLSDIQHKLILNVKTFSDHTHEIKAFKPLVEELLSALKIVLADKAYDSMKNREYLWKNKIENHIPLRKREQSRLEELGKPSKKQKARELFNKQTYNHRAIAETVNSAIKTTLGSFIRAKKAQNQQKQATIKAIAYNIEHIEKTIKISIFINS